MFKKISGDEKHKRLRGENWLEDDKRLLLELVKERVTIVENKNTDTNTNMKKKAAWDEVLTSFNVMCKGTKRSLTQLKSQWGVLKMNVKIDKAAQRRELFKTGGGPSTSTAPPTDSRDIESWLPAEFLVDTNEFDSDSNYEIVEKENKKTTTNPSSQTLAPVYVELQQHSGTSKPQIEFDESENAEVLLAEPQQCLTEVDLNVPSISSKRYKGKSRISKSEGFKTTSANSSITAIADHEIKCKAELHSLQVQNEERKARNLDIKYEILKEKLIYYKNLNRKAAEDIP